MPYRVIGAIGEMALATGVTMVNKAAVMTLDNQVMFCGNMTIANYAQNTVLATLPDEQMWPSEPVVIPCWLQTNQSGNQQYTMVGIGIQTDGTLVMGRNVQNGVLFLNGAQFTANSKYYTPEIGNIYNNGTSPLSET